MAHGDYYTYSDSTSSATWNNWVDTTCVGDETTSGIATSWGTSSNSTSNEYTVTVGVSNGPQQVWYEWIDEAGQRRIRSGGVSTEGINHIDAAAQEAFQLEQAQRQKEKKKAEETAEELLMMILDDEQQAEYKESKSFVVAVGDRRFRLKHGRAHNIHELDENGHKIANICCHIKPLLPNGDNLVAQKLALENDPEHFLATANIS